MKTLKYVYSLFILTLITGCNKVGDNSKHNHQKKTLLVATHNISDISKDETTFKIFTDSTYLLTESFDEPDHTKYETFTGKAQIENDTIKFFFRLGWNNADKAILRNGFIVFINGDNTSRMLIKSTTLKVNNLIDFSKFKDFAVFDFEKKYSSIPDKEKYSNYELTTKDLTRIDSILKKAFADNKEVKEYNKYIKQLISVRNEKNENIIFIHCFCKLDPYLSEEFRYQQIIINDGGNCNIYIKLNLTTGKIITFNTSG